MHSKLRAAKLWLKRHDQTLLWLGIGLYAAIFSAICAWKYSVFAYHGIDLAYFNQVFWNTVHGHPFRQTIHPHLSLGDHAEFAILLLAPLYAIAQDPRTLLVLQSIALALPAWPIFLLAKKRFGHASLLPLLVAFLWLASPLVQNINLFEFHILPFALLPLFFALYEYDRGNKKRFLLYALLALIVREDVALVVTAIGLLAWLEKKSWWWHLTPALLGGAWFIAAMNVIGHFAPAASYKYGIYYAWLGPGPLEIIKTIFTQPLKVLAHLATVPNLEMFLGFGMPVIFIFLLWPKKLILCLLPLLQIILSAPGGSAIVLQTHYATLFLPGIFLATIDGIKTIKNKLIIVLLFLCAIYSSVILGPLPHAIKRIVFSKTETNNARIASEMLSRIPLNAPVAASYGLLPALSSRPQLYSLHYLFLGREQFDTGPYATPPDLRYIALDTSDLLTYAAQFPITGWTKPYYLSGFARLSPFLDGQVYARGQYQLYSSPESPRPTYDRNPSAAEPLLLTSNRDYELSGDLVFSGAAEFRENHLLVIAGSWRGAVSADGLAMRVIIRGADNQPVLDEEYPLGNSIMTDAKIDFPMELTLPLNEIKPGTYRPEIIIEKQKTALVLDGWRDTVRAVSEREALGAFTLTEFTRR